MRTWLHHILIDRNNTSLTDRIQRCQLGKRGNTAIFRSTRDRKEGVQGERTQEVMTATYYLPLDSFRGDLVLSPASSLHS
jgi:hypothetical protein